jgi:putative phosphoesterase
MARPSRSGITIGLISDTHGLLRPEVLRALGGVQRIIHAGDIGGPGILEALARIAPVDAVAGNNDRAPWAANVPLRLSLQIEGIRIHVLHDMKELDVSCARLPFQVVVAGHSHRPEVAERDGVLFVNPGSAGRQRFSLPVTLAYLEITAGTARARIFELL